MNSLAHFGDWLVGWSISRKRAFVTPRFEALNPSLMSNYLPTPLHMAGDPEGSPDSLCLVLIGNPLLKREALSKIKLPLSLLSLLTVFE